MSYYVISLCLFLLRCLSTDLHNFIFQYLVCIRPFFNFTKSHNKFLTTFFVLQVKPLNVQCSFWTSFFLFKCLSFMIILKWYGWDYMLTAKKRKAKVKQQTARQRVATKMVVYVIQYGRWWVELKMTCNALVGRPTI